MIMTTKITYYAIASNEPHTMLDYLGYCLYFPGIAIGPTFGFQTYIDYVSRKKQY